MDMWGEDLNHGDNSASPSAPPFSPPESSRTDQLEIWAWEGGECQLEDQNVIRTKEVVALQRKSATMSVLRVKALTSLVETFMEPGLTTNI